MRNSESHADVGAWAACSGFIFICLGGALLMEVVTHGLYPLFWKHLAALVTASTIVGWVFRQTLVEKGYHLSRQRIAAEDDYEDRPREW